MRGVPSWWWPAWEYAEAGCRNRPASRPWRLSTRQGVADVVAVRRFGVAEGVPCGAEQVVRRRARRPGRRQARDLRVDRGDEQRAPPAGGHDQVQAPFPPGPQGMVHGLNRKLMQMLVATAVASKVVAQPCRRRCAQPALRGDELGHSRPAAGAAGRRGSGRAGRSSSRAGCTGTRGGRTAAAPARRGAGRRSGGSRAGRGAATTASPVPAPAARAAPGPGSAGSRSRAASRPARPRSRPVAGVWADAQWRTVRRRARPWTAARRCSQDARVSCRAGGTGSAAAARQITACPWPGPAGRAAGWSARCAAWSTGTRSSRSLVICSVPFSMARIAAPRMSWDRLPIMPPVRP